MRRVRSAWLFAVLATAGPGCGGDSRDAPAPARNVLIVVLDTLRADRLSCYGAKRETSPGLDALARESIVFENAQSAAPLTVASLLSLVTSLYPEVHQVQGALNPGRMSEGVTTLAEILAWRGYATAAFTEGGYAKPDFGLGQGFQVFPRNPGDDESNVSNLLFPSRLEGNLDRTIEWLRKERREPFLLLFHTYEIHAPYRTREDFVRLFRPGFDEAADHARVARAIERWNRERQATPEDCLAMLQHLYQCSLEGLPALEDPDAFGKAAGALRLGPGDAVTCEPLLALVRDLYDASIRYTDGQLERLWNALEELGLSDDTLVVVLSDHGEGLGDHGEMEHSDVLLEEALRVPLIVRVPGRGFVPRRVPAMVRSIDVMPTVLELLGIDADRLLVQGRSLVPLMRGEHDPARVSFSHARRIGPDQNAQYSVRRGDWRLIHEPAIDRRWLYDLASDPGELEDLAAKRPDVVAELSLLLARQSEQDRWLRERIATRPETLEIDDATMEELRKLGYAGGK